MNNINNLTIVIPTDGRYDTLIHTVRSCLRLRTLRQLLILDSSSTKNIPPDVNLILQSDARIEYKKTPCSFNAVQNFNFGIDYIVSDYTLYMGDDDCVTSAVDQILHINESVKAKAITCTFPASYNWPGYRTSALASDIGGKIFIQKFDSSVSIKKTKSELSTVAETSYLGPQRLPRVYLGIVKTSVLKEINDRAGAVFGGVSPDIYSSVLLSLYIDDYLLVDYPAIVPGGSAKSTTGTSARGKHQGVYEKSDHLNAFPNLVWDMRIPRLYSVHTVWSYSMQKALEVWRTGLSINFNNLYKSFDISGYALSTVLFRCILSNTGSIKFATTCIILSNCRACMNSIKRLLSPIKRKLIAPKAGVIESIETSYDATLATEQYLIEVAQTLSWNSNLSKVVR